MAYRSPVDAMLNAFYAGLVLKYRSVESLWRNLVPSPALMKVRSFSILETAELA